MDNLIEFQVAWAQAEFCMLNDEDKATELKNYQSKLLELAAKIKDA